MRQLSGWLSITAQRLGRTSRSSFGRATSPRPRRRTLLTTELEEDRESDYGTLKAGARVLGARYRDLHYALDRVPRWYTDNTSETAEIVVPVELVLHTSFEMEQAALPPRGASAQQRQGVSKGAVVLAETDHEAAMEELRKRYGGD